MPYPSQIDRDLIIDTARHLIETVGVDKLSLRLLADALEVKPPSLYRYVANKNALLLAVNEVTTRELVASLQAATDDTADLIERLLQIARAYRAFAHEHPVAYALANTSTNTEIMPAAEEREQLVLPLQALFADLCGDANSLVALRGAYAFLHGWVMLEITEQLQRGGDLGVHFERSFRAYIQGWIEAGSL